MTRLQRAYFADVETIFLSDEPYPYWVVGDLYREYKLKFPGERIVLHD